MKKKISTFLIVIVLLIIYLIVGEQFNIFLKCPIHLLTKLYCPGCGSTRMLKSLMHGKFYQAFRFNPLLFVMIPLYLVYLIINLIAEKKGTVPITKKFEPKIWYFLISVFLIFGVLRNIPLFDFLAPTIIK